MPCDDPGALRIRWVSDIFQQVADIAVEVGMVIARDMVTKGAEEEDDGRVDAQTGE
jgi:hypothetical protein